LKNRRNYYVNVKVLFLIHVKIKIEHGQGSGSRLGLGLDAKRENLIRKKKLEKQAMPIPTHGPYVRTKIIAHIYAKRYKKYSCYC